MVCERGPQLPEVQPVHLLLPRQVREGAQLLLLLNGAAEWEELTIEEQQQLRAFSHLLREQQWDQLPLWGLWATLTNFNWAAAGSAAGVQHWRTAPALVALNQTRPAHLAGALLSQPRCTQLQAPAAAADAAAAAAAAAGVEAAGVGAAAGKGGGVQLPAVVAAAVAAVAAAAAAPPFTQLLRLNACVVGLGSPSISNTCMPAISV